MKLNRDPIESTNTARVTRRRMLGTLGAAMGALTVTRGTQAASAASTPTSTPCSVRVAVLGHRLFTTPTGGCIASFLRQNRLG